MFVVDTQMGNAIGHDSLYFNEQLVHYIKNLMPRQLEFCSPNGGPVLDSWQSYWQHGMVRLTY